MYDGMRTGWDHASFSEASSIEITTFHPAGMDTIHVAELVSNSPKSALMKHLKYFLAFLPWGRKGM